MGIRKRKAALSLEIRHKMYNNGYNTGYDEGHSQGYNLGYQVGKDAFAAGFDGTSIVIPSLNQQTYLADCIESIRKYTPEPHEIIVIDNGSTDGTADYLRSLPRGTVRYKICESNLGFAGGVNQGLMMARGSTIMFLNNDTIVTERWLANLLTCLHSTDRFGLVGPVTNYISGEQLIETKYESTEEMHRFAATFNQSDPGKWTVTGRLTGFCVLMKRELFQRLGYLDEGFEVGNCEDDDYGYRNRLLGLDLVIAKDTFIHHVGSTTIKTLTPSQFEEMYARNLAFYSGKWGETPPLLQEVSVHWSGVPIATKNMYPTCVTVKGTSGTLYWIEQGERRPLESAEGITATRLSQIDLRSWTIGEPISRAEWNTKQNALANPRRDTASPPVEGGLVRSPDGKVYQHSSGKLHRFVTEWAQEVWQLNRLPVHPLSEEEMAQFAIGLPIIAPPVIKAGNV
ncbi:MAG: glycosyl transferase family 2 [Paenibacillus sp.]|nr:glycosyl transferase family 2 [Paenibacillus sp.]